MATSPSFFRILKGAEKKDADTKKSVMLDGQKSGLAIQEGTVYVTTDDGNMYIDVSSTKRVKIGALADKALQAERDYKDNIIAKYFNAANLKKADDNNEILLYRGTGTDTVTLSLTGATESAAGLITAKDQTLAGNKTFTGKILIKGSAESKPLQVRGIVGNDATTSTISDLYLQYQANKLIYLGNDAKYTISADGSQYSGNAASATKAIRDNNNNPITDYIKDVTYSVSSKGDKVSFNFKRGDSAQFSHSITGATTAAAGLVTTGAQSWTGKKTFDQKGQLDRAGYNAGAYITGRDGAFITQSSVTGYSPFLSLKTTNGSWEMGAYKEYYSDYIILTHVTDDIYTAKKGDPKAQIFISPDGDIYARQFMGLASKAQCDGLGNNFVTKYIATLQYVAQDTSNTTSVPSIKGMAMDGSTISTIPLLSATTRTNGLVSTTAQTFGGNKTFNNNLTVVGATALSGILGVTGATTLASTLTVTGVTTLNDTLNVAKETTLKSTLGVTGKTSLGGDLSVTGTTTLTKSLTANDIINSTVEKSAPFIVKSAIKVSNLNADKVDGYDVTNDDFSAAKDTDMSIPSVGAVIKTFLPLLQSLQGLRYRGSVDLTQTTDDGRFGKDVLGTVKVGDVFMISKGGAYAGIYLEPADMLVCVAKSGSTITWNYIQSNINGAVTIKGATESGTTGANPLVSVDSIPVFSAVTGRQITGSKIFIDGTGNLLPASGNTTQCLGSKERKWITVWANTFNGTDFTGNAASATQLKTARKLTIGSTGKTFNGTADVAWTLAEIGAAAAVHSHNYAGSDKPGGAATSANKLNTNNGSATNPVYFSNGVPVACTYTIQSNVPKDAKFTDTNTWRGIQNSLNSTSTTDSLSAYQGKWLNENKTNQTNWDAVIKCATWSRICYIPYFQVTVGSFFLLNVSATRANVVYNETFAISVNHSSKSKIVKIGTANSSSIQIRVNSDSGGNCYIELYDAANSATNTTSQTVQCRVVGIRSGVVTGYTAFTDGTTLPTNFSTSSSLTVNTNSLQGNLTWGEITGKPSTFSPASHSHAWSEITNKPSKFTPADHTHNSLVLAPANLASTVSSKFTSDSGPLNARFYSIANSITNQPEQYGFLMTVANGSGSAEMHQLWVGQPNGHIWHRGTNTDTASANPSFKMLWEKGDAVTGAVWNDYAECRQADTQEPGYVLSETGKDTLTKTSNRLQHFAGVSSDTWGFSQGETEKAKTHIAVAGRVLVYPYQDRENYHPGDCVCATKGGMVDIMTREEIIKYPDRIVGIVSCVPDYETWGGGKDADRESVKVNGRIWIKVK